MVKKKIKLDKDSSDNIFVVKKGDGPGWRKIKLLNLGEAGIYCVNIVVSILLALLC